MRVALPAIILLAALGGASTRLAPSQSSDEDEGLLTITQSAYAEIRVVDKNGLRYLLIDGGTHTIVDPQTWKSSFPYVDVMDLPGMYFQEPGNLLVVGLGGGSVVKRYAQKGWRIDAVEIDPVVTSVAYQYFGLEREEARVFHMDGRRYLKTRDHDYDIVVMDAFGSSSIPFHLVTVEAFELIASRLSEGGLLAMNIESVGWYDILVRSLVATMKQVFPHVTVLPIEEPRTAIGNVVIMASGRELELREELPDPISRLSSEYNRVHAWVNSFEPDITGAPVLTDDLNPVDIWAERINLVARRNLHTYFGSNGLGW